MKLKINGFTNELEFYNDKVSVLAIKDTKCFTNTIQEINDKINGIESDKIFLLDDKENELKMSNKMCIILDLFNIDYNSKKILGKLYDKISENIENSGETKLQNLFIEIRKSIMEEINELPFEFTMSDDIDIINILKLYNLKVDILSYETILERIEFFIDLNATLNIFNVIIIPNLKMYLSEDELIELYKYSLYNNINLLLIERNEYTKLKYEINIIIDENFNDFLK